MIEHKKNAWITEWFTNHSRKLIQKNFRKCSLTESSANPKFIEGVPIIAISNHPSWWDALSCLYISHGFLKRETYGVFDEEQLKRYGIFRSIGAYSFNSTSIQEGQWFLKYTRNLLENTSRLLWIFPQGDIFSTRHENMEFKKGFANLVTQFQKVHLLKMIVSYDFWLDSKPEIVIDLLPLETLVPGKGVQFTRDLTQRVNQEMNERLAFVNDIVKYRKSNLLKPLFVKEHGSNLVYDSVRAIKAWLRKEDFKKSHVMTD